MNKGQISNFARNIGMIYLFDRIRYYIMKFQNRKINNEFRKDNPEVKLPPDYLMYESFQINYQKYYFDGYDTAMWLADHLGRHKKPENIKILDWGCGPGRIIRHLPSVIGNGCEFYGTDSNDKSIRWCSENISGIRFHRNTLEPQLPFKDDFFEIIYGISVFTHLSEKLHQDWYQELYRILKPDGIMFFTTQGDNFKLKLTASELDQYNRGALVVRGKAKEGHRTYSAFHPAKFMVDLFRNAEILEHIETKPEIGKWLPQDIWIIKKKNL